MKVGAEARAMAREAMALVTLDAVSAERDSLQALADALRVGHDRYEFLRCCSLRQLTEIWEAALQGDAQFDAIVDKLRLAARATDSREGT